MINEQQGMFDFDRYEEQLALEREDLDKGLNAFYDEFEDIEDTSI